MTNINFKIEIYFHFLCTYINEMNLISIDQTQSCNIE